MIIKMVVVVLGLWFEEVDNIYIWIPFLPCAQVTKYTDECLPLGTRDII